MQLLLCQHAPLVSFLLIPLSALLRLAPAFAFLGFGVRRTRIPLILGSSANWLWRCKLATTNDFVGSCKPHIARMNWAAWLAAAAHLVSWTCFLLRPGTSCHMLENEIAWLTLRMLPATCVHVLKVLLDLAYAHEPCCIAGYGCDGLQPMVVANAFEPHDLSAMKLS